MPQLTLLIPGDDIGNMESTAPLVTCIVLLYFTVITQIKRISQAIADHTPLCLSAGFRRNVVSMVSAHILEVHWAASLL